MEPRGLSEGINLGKEFETQGETWEGKKGSGGKSMEGDRGETGQEAGRHAG